MKVSDLAFRSLVEAGAKFDIVNSGNLSPLHLLASYGTLDQFKIALSTFCYKAVERTLEFLPPVIRTIIHSYTDAKPNEKKSAINCQLNGTGVTPISFAISSKKDAIIDFLSKDPDVDLNLVDFRGRIQERLTKYKMEQEGLKVVSEPSSHSCVPHCVIS